jgi:hypothetical protein
VVSLFFVVDVLRGGLPPPTANTKFPKSHTGGPATTVWVRLRQSRPCSFRDVSRRDAVEDKGLVFIVPPCCRESTRAEARLTTVVETPWLAAGSSGHPGLGSRGIIAESDSSAPIIPPASTNRQCGAGRGGRMDGSETRCLPGHRVASCREIGSPLRLEHQEVGDRGLPVGPLEVVTGT